MTSDTTTSGAAIQGRLWSVRTDDWANIQERQVAPAFDAALEALRVTGATRLLDAGCGAGLALRYAADRGAEVTGLDASEAMVAHARRRVPGAQIVRGDIEDLPFDDDRFDVVTGFNSFQYAGRRHRAVAAAAARQARQGSRPPRTALPEPRRGRGRGLPARVRARPRRAPARAGPRTGRS